MRETHMVDRLSGYIDGCARNPDRIARHLQQCEACAKRHAEMLRVGDALRGMPEPEVSPGFAGRVMAEVKGQDAIAWPCHTGRLALATAAAVAVLLLLAGTALLRSTGETGQQETADMAPGTAFAHDHMEALEWGLVSHVAVSGDEDGLEVLVCMLPATAWEPPSEEELLAALALTEWFEELADEVDASQRLDELLDGMNETELLILEQLLWEWQERSV